MKKIEINYEIGYYFLTFKNRLNGSKLFVRSIMSDYDLKSVSIYGYQLIETKIVSKEEYENSSYSVFKINR